MHGLHYTSVGSATRAEAPIEYTRTFSGLRYTF